MSTSPTVEELKEALRLGIVAFLKAGGYQKVAAAGKLDEVLVQFFNVEKRSVRPQPRRVERSQAVNWSAYEPAVTTIQREFEAGRDMVPRLSRKLAVKRSAAATDDLLNDWRLQHLHLSPRATDGSVPGGPDVLVAWVDDSHALFVGIIDHHGWGCHDLIDRLAAEWPAVAKPFQLSGVLSTTTASDDERVRMRGAGINVVTSTAGGETLAPIGGGVALSGQPIEAVQRMLAVQRALRTVTTDLVPLEPQLQSLGLPVRISASPLKVEVLGFW